MTTYCPNETLYEVAAAIDRDPDLDLIYSDEDTLDASGRRRFGYFKHDWNPDLLLGHNMVSHLGVYRRALVRKIGGFRVGLEGSQDYDLALRASGQHHARENPSHPFGPVPLAPRPGSGVVLDQIPAALHRFRSPRDRGLPGKSAISRLRRDGGAGPRLAGSAPRAIPDP